MTLVERLPTGRAGQALAIGLTLVAAFLLWQAIAVPLIDWYAARAETVGRERAVAARMEALAASLPVLRREAARVRAAGPPASTLLAGGSDAIAAASLQGRIQDMASSAGTALSSTEALPARQQGAYRRISLRISFNATLPVLVQLLQSLDGSTPRMLVDDLQLHTSPIIVAQNKGGSPPLDTTMTVIGFRAGHGADENAQGSDAQGSGEGAGP